VGKFETGKPALQAAKKCFFGFEKKTPDYLFFSFNKGQVAKRQYTL